MNGYSGEEKKGNGRESKILYWTGYTGDSKRQNGADEIGKGEWWKGPV